MSQPALHTSASPLLHPSSALDPADSFLSDSYCLSVPPMRILTPSPIPSLGTPNLPFAPEIIWWTPSQSTLAEPQEFREDAAVWRDKGRGCMAGTFHGAELDNPNSRVIVTIWLSLPHHKAFMSHPSYPSLILPLLDAMSPSPPSILNQVLMRTPLSSLLNALSAPITQFIYITLRPLHDIDWELVPILKELQRKIELVEGCEASCWGPEVESESNKVQVGIIGWRSLEDRNRAAEGPLKDVVSRIKELGSVEVRYASLVSDAEI